MEEGLPEDDVSYGQQKPKRYLHRLICWLLRIQHEDLYLSAQHYVGWNASWLPENINPRYNNLRDLWYMFEQHLKREYNAKLVVDHCWIEFPDSETKIRFMLTCEPNTTVMGFHQ